MSIVMSGHSHTAAQSFSIIVLYRLGLPTWLFRRQISRFWLLFSVLGYRKFGSFLSFGLFFTLLEIEQGFSLSISFWFFYEFEGVRNLVPDGHSKDHQGPRKIDKWGGGGHIFIYSCSQTVKTMDFKILISISKEINWA